MTQGNRDNELKGEKKYTLSNRVKCPQINNKLQNPKQIHRSSTVRPVQKVSMAAGISVFLLDVITAGSLRQGYTKEES